MLRILLYFWSFLFDIIIWCLLKGLFWGWSHSVPSLSGSLWHRKVFLSGTGKTAKGSHQSSEAQRAAKHRKLKSEHTIHNITLLLTGLRKTHWGPLCPHVLSTIHKLTTDPRGENHSPFLFSPSCEVLAQVSAHLSLTPFADGSVHPPDQSPASISGSQPWNMTLFTSFTLLWFPSTAGKWDRIRFKIPILLVLHILGLCVLGHSRPQIKTIWKSNCNYITHTQTFFSWPLLPKQYSKTTISIAFILGSRSHLESGASDSCL
jgi:hypothetical protein